MRQLDFEVSVVCQVIFWHSYPKQHVYAAQGHYYHQNTSVLVNVCELQCSKYKLNCSVFPTASGHEIVNTPCLAVEQFPEDDFQSVLRTLGT